MKYNKNKLEEYAEPISNTEKEHARMLSIW